jgi:hypothetical protein
MRWSAMLADCANKATCAEVAPELLAEQNLDIGLIINHENEEVQFCSPDLAIVAARRGRTNLNSVHDSQQTANWPCAEFRFPATESLVRRDARPPGLEQLKERFLELSKAPLEKPKDKDRRVIGWGVGGALCADEIWIDRVAAEQIFASSSGPLALSSP